MSRSSFTHLLQSEENVDLQMRSAVAVASFIEYCTLHQVIQPPEKIVKNLCTFLCQDAETTPTFAYSRKTTDGILSFQKTLQPSGATTQRNGKEAAKEKEKAPDKPSADEASKTRLARRGAGLAFDQLSAKFGNQLLQVIPNMWQSMAGGIISTFKSGKLRDSSS
jgi:TATA-binding protein-associated factor